MEELIAEVFELIKDYRADELLPQVRMSKTRIKRWIEQFDEDDRSFMLTELKKIFGELYCSKAHVKKFLKKVVDRLTKDLGYKSAHDFLKMTIFLDLQSRRKSQKVMLKLLSELLAESYEFNIQECGTVQKKHFIYIDDILCTGNTLIRDIEDWSGKPYSPGKTNLEAIKDKTSELIFAYIFIHKKNYDKKVIEMRHKIDSSISANHKMYRLKSIQNDEKRADSILDIILPVETDDEQVSDYKAKIIAEVDEYTKKYGKNSSEEFFRKTGRPTKETLFTSPENRNRFETILLKKGIEILDRTKTKKKNMRALGYCLPSQKSFGFGTLCLTWRNIPNNTPLVFWYAAGEFYPLFVKNQTNEL